MKTKTTNESFSAYIGRLNIGQDLLGSGAYGSVYAHPTCPNVVVKVFDAKEDARYMKYLTWCLANQNLSYVPKIHSVRQFNSKRRKEKITVVFMERLEPIDELRSKPKKVINKVNDIIDALHNERFGTLLRIDPKMKKLIKFLENNSDNLDIHDENYMLRKGGQFVLTDPLA